MMGFGMGFGLPGLLLMILLWAGLIILAVWLVRGLFPRADQPRAALERHSLSAREILDQRYARGEIGREEYDRMMDAISR
jgi:putative membrane protein